jgi:hypothetical protein
VGRGRIRRFFLFSLLSLLLGARCGCRCRCWGLGLGRRRWGLWVFLVAWWCWLLVWVVFGDLPGTSGAALVGGWWVVGVVDGDYRGDYTLWGTVWVMGIIMG